MAKLTNEEKLLQLSEKKFGVRVKTFLRNHGWHVQSNSWVGVGNQYMKGFPDLVCVRQKVLFIELKTATGKLKPAQQDWANWIVEAGGDWLLLRPQQWEEFKKRPDIA